MKIFLTIYLTLCSYFFVSAQIPSVPILDSATSISQRSFTINWEASTGAATYFLYLAIDSTFTHNIYNPLATEGDGVINLDTPAVRLYQVVSGLSPGTTYYYRIRAGTQEGVLSPSSRIESTTTIASGPIAISATDVLFDGFTANWIPINGASSYSMDVSTDYYFSTFIVNNANVGTGASFVVTGLDAATTYYYQIRGNKPNGASPNSNVITILTTPSSPIAAPPVNISPTYFIANWHTVKGATGYLLDVSQDNFNTYFHGYESEIVTDTFQIISLYNNTGVNTYQYRVRAHDLSGASSYSNVISTVVTEIVPSASSSVRLFPNPSQKAIIISGIDQPIEQGEIVDLAGNIRLSSLIQEGSTYRIDISSLSPGMYVVCLSAASKVYNLKFIKY